MSQKLEKQVDELKYQEDQAKNAWNKSVLKLRELIEEKRNSLKEMIIVLKSNKQHQETLRVENQKLINQIEYEKAVSDSHDAAQYEQRIRDLAAEIEESELSSESLQKDLEKLSEKW